ncbi:MAG: hypothetical protein WAM68_09720, partial [Acidobacteriaceae bacterium]
MSLVLELAAAVFNGGEEATGAAVADGAIPERLEETPNMVLKGLLVGGGEDTALKGGAPVGGDFGAGGRSVR